MKSVGATLTVHVGREQLHELDPETRSFETDGPFEVELRNHRRSVHVHLSLDGDLSAVATLPDNNHFVESEGTVAVPVDVSPADYPVTGRMKVVSGYGAESAYVEVTVKPPDTTKPPVEVDETLSRPKPAQEPSNSGGRSGGAAIEDLFSGSLPVWALAGVAVLIAVATAATVQNVAVLLGVAAVVAGVIVAFALLRE